MATFIRIVGVPDGEAPLWVREEWVGLSLPLAQSGTSVRTYFTSGVLTAPKGLLSFLIYITRRRGQTGNRFSCRCRDRSCGLAEKNLEAAAWWQENTVLLNRPGRKFMFQRHVAEVYESDL